MFLIRRGQSEQFFFNVAVSTPKKDTMLAQFNVRSQNKSTKCHVGFFFYLLAFDFLSRFSHSFTKFSRLKVVASLT